MFEQREECPQGPKVLAAWESGDVSAVATHVEECARCHQLLDEAARLHRALQAGDPGSRVPVTAPERRAELLEYCRQSLRPGPAVPTPRPFRWLWPATVGFAAVGLALLLLRPLPRRDRTAVAPVAPVVVAPHKQVEPGALRELGANALAVSPALKPHRDLGQPRVAVRSAHARGSRETRLRQMATTPRLRSLHRTPSAPEPPPLIVVEAEGGAPAPYTVTVNASGSNAAVTQAAFQETHP